MRSSCRYSSASNADSISRTCDGRAALLWLIRSNMLIAIIALGAVLSAVLSSMMYIAAWRLSSSVEKLPHGTLPISVLKPLKGLDDELEENLESFCRQTHRQYEIIVGAADANDPALAVAHRVRERHPLVAFRIISGEWPTGLNPKVRNLRKLLTRARYSAILVSDGDVRVGTDYLSVMAGALERPKAGLVSNLIVGTGERTIGAACENLRLNGFVAATIAAAQRFLGHPVVVGKSMLFRRDALTNAGGFAAAADVLAEDYLLGRAVAAAGYRVEVLGYPVLAFNRDGSIPKMFRRHTRWSQIRRQIAPFAFALEPLASPALWLILFAAVWSGLGRPLPGAAVGVIAVSGCATLLEAALCTALQGRALNLQKLVLLPLSSVLGLGAWILAWGRNRILWREQYLRIGAGSQLLPSDAGLARTNEAVRIRRAA